MSLQDLQKKYGAHDDPMGQILRAIRGEVKGGDDALCALHYLEKIQKKMKGTNAPGAADAQAAYNACRRMVRCMRDVIYDRYRIGLKYRQEHQSDQPKTT